MLKLSKWGDEASLCYGLMTLKHMKLISNNFIVSEKFKICPLMGKIFLPLMKLIQFLFDT